MSSDFLDSVRIPVEFPLVRAVLAEEAYGRTGPATARLGDFLSDLLETYIDKVPGCVVITGFDYLNEAEANVLVLAASRMAGELLPQDSHATYLRHVTDRGVRIGQGPAGRYSDSRQGGSLHTDGPHMPFAPPEIFTLFCVRQAPQGGTLILVHVDDIVAGMSKRDKAILEGNFHFDRREELAIGHTVVRPILTYSLSGSRLCYLREYIEIGHQHNNVPDLTTDQLSAMDALDDLLNDPHFQYSGRLRPGEMIFVNNCMVCHGRTAFVDDAAKKRLLLRSWIRRDSRRPPAVSQSK